MEEKKRIAIKALEDSLKLSEACLHGLKDRNYEGVNSLLEKRIRVIDIALKLIGSDTEGLEIKITRLSKLNDEILPLLVAEKQFTQIEIAKTIKNKENFKGYNLKHIK